MLVKTHDFLQENFSLDRKLFSRQKRLIFFFSLTSSADSSHQCLQHQHRAEIQDPQGAPRGKGLYKGKMMIKQRLMTIS